MALCALIGNRAGPALIFIERVQAGTVAQFCAKMGSVWPFYSAGGATTSIPAFHVAGNDAINVVPLRPGIRSRFFAACGYAMRLGMACSAPRMVKTFILGGISGLRLY